ncbi:MAG: 50S ribosomal protein L24 [Desulfobulbaceae bacterium]|nr:50S ribosomal protein L24 [Desulfobulbaceae bacterium]MCK5341110.1 50S ribosomal protein L24 [Desulfobulbaceae bacterium]MCK5403596.1 50S ribosomal protein L24 [Desulfobulbaceae bacterium]
MQGANRLKRQDQVEVIAGKDKGRVGKVLKVLSREKILVEKINMVKRHMKPSMANQQGGIIDKEAPIHASNVMLICPKCTKNVRIRKKILDDGVKVRICKKCGESVESKA